MAEEKMPTPTPEAAAPAVPVKPKGDKKWLMWGLIGFTVILVVTAVILFLQLRKPVEEPLPKPKPVPSASPVVAPVQEVTGEGVCEVNFTVEEKTPVCYDECVEDTDCPTDLKCMDVNGVDRCVNPECVDNEDCSCNEELVCFDECVTDSDCPGDLRCQDDTGTYRCVNADCPEEADCTCSEEALVCFDKCELDSDCPGDLRCMTYPGTSDTRCLNADCREETDCGCPGASPVPSPTPSPGASPIARAEEPALPEAGISAPAVLGVSIGLLMVILGLLF